MTFAIVQLNKIPFEFCRFKKRGCRFKQKKAIVVFLNLKNYLSFCLKIDKKYMYFALNNQK